MLARFAKQAYAATDGGRVAVGRAHQGAGGAVHSYGRPSTPSTFDTGRVTAQVACRRSLRALSIEAPGFTEALARIRPRIQTRVNR